MRLLLITLLATLSLPAAAGQKESAAVTAAPMRNDRFALRLDEAADAADANPRYSLDGAVVAPGVKREAVIERFTLSRLVPAKGTAACDADSVFSNGFEG